jgi:hypothetical protein
MLNKPRIKTAIPKQRYKLGAFSIVILGDIQSEDAREYHYVLAAVHEGDPEPGLYLTVEPAPSAGSTHGALSLRLIMADGEEVLGVSDELSKLDVFAAEGLTVVKTLLQLTDEEAFRLL